MKILSVLVQPVSNTQYCVKDLYMLNSFVLAGDCVSYVFATSLFVHVAP